MNIHNVCYLPAPSIRLFGAQKWVMIPGWDTIWQACFVPNTYLFNYT